jgi:hypothetical protein
LLLFLAPTRRLLVESVFCRETRRLELSAAHFLFTPQPRQFRFQLSYLRSDR